MKRKYSILWVIFLLITANTIGQNSEIAKSLEGQDYWINNEFKIVWTANIKWQAVLTKNGEVILVYEKVGTFYFTKFDKELNLVAENKISGVVPKSKYDFPKFPKEFLLTFEDKFAIICYNENDAEQLEMHRILFFDDNMNFLSDDWEVISINRTRKEPKIVVNYAEKRKKERKKLGGYFSNESGLMCIQQEVIDEENKLVHYISRFDIEGNKIYSKEVVFDEKDGQVFLSNIIRRNDGSVLYFGQTDGFMFYNEISPDGDEDYNTFAVSEGFSIMNVVENPDKQDEFMFIGLNSEYRLSLYYFSRNNFNRFPKYISKQLIQIPLDDESQKFNIASIRGEIIDDKFYLFGIAWDQGYQEGWLKENTTNILAVSVDLKDDNIKSIFLSKRANEIYDDFSKEDEITLKVATLGDINKDGIELIVNLRQLNVEVMSQTPDGVTVYRFGRNNRLVIDFESEKITYKRGSFSSQIELDGSGRVILSVSRDDSFDKSPYAILTTRYDLSKKKYTSDYTCHLTTKLKNYLNFKTLGTYTEDGRDYLIAISTQVSFVLLKLPL